MQTPAGRECPYYYQDFHRGRSITECRLLGPRSGWTPDLCRTCPVPGIALANSCREMRLQAEVKSGFLGFGRKVRVSAFCHRVNRPVEDPYVGCGECHRILEDFEVREPPK
jgi:hypothetical protein